MITTILFHSRRDSGFVGIKDLGSDVDMKSQIDNVDRILNSPSRRQSRMYSMDFSFLGVDEDPDRIVNKYKQVNISLRLLDSKIENSITSRFSSSPTSVSCKIIVSGFGPISPF